VVARSLCPVRQPAVPGPQGLGEGVEVIALLIWSKAPYLSQARSSSSCRQQTKTNERRAAKANAKTTEQGKRQQANERRRTWKTRHAGPPWIRSASFSARLSEASWPQSSSHSCCSSWVSAKWEPARRPAPAPAPGSPLGRSK
jgi:hypothetical protein